MIHKKYIFLILLGALIVSCELDNYDSPDGGVHGILTDQMTNTNLQSQQPDGFTIRLFESGGSVNEPILIPGKPDGTFENSFIFQNEYKVIPSDGAFFPVDTVTVQVGSSTEINFDVMPFLAVTNVDITPSEGQITANYNIARERVGDKIVERRMLVSEIQRVNNVLFDYQEQTDLSDIPDEDILTTDYTDVLNGLTSGQTYFVRIAVRTDNPLGRYNYSETFEITIP